MKFLKTLVAAAGLVFAAACSDTSNQMTGIEPSFAKAGKGGYGDPHFTPETVCTFNEETGRLACDYQIAGLSSNSTGLGKLEANVVVGWYCDYPEPTTGGTRDYSSDKVGLEYDFIYYADKGGVAKGHVEDETLSYLFNLKPSCSGKTINGNFVRPSPSEFEYHLDQYASPLLVPYLMPGAWSMYALVATPKAIRYIFFNGAWTPEVIG